jgi:hypothetical protein
MKIIIRVFLLCVLGFNSCKKDDSVSVEEEAKLPPTPAAIKKFSCNINGVLFETDSADYNPFYIDTAANFKILVCGAMIDTTYVGFGLTLQGISVSLPSSVLSYPVVSIDIDRTVNGVYYDSYMAISTNLQITSNDTINHKVSGIFSGIVVESSIQDTVHISNGKFTNLSYFLIY